MANETKPVDTDTAAKEAATQDNQAVQIETLRGGLATEQTAHQATKDELLVAQAKLAVINDNTNALTEAMTIIDGQRTQIAEQEAQIVGLQTNPAEFPTITVGKKSYEVRAKSFKYGKADYTVQQLLADKELQKELLKKGVGFIVEVTKA